MLNLTQLVFSRIALTAFLSLIFSITSAQNSAHAPKHEMRGVWVATVANIDWPSKAGLSAKQQMQEALNIIEHSKELGLNTIFLQVRPSSDVIYKSDYEPWSKVLSGVAGEDPKYDPLAFWIEHAHEHGLELHAWINPYRASMNTKDKLPAKHPYHSNPDMFVEYGGKLYYNPGVPESNIHINKITKELVTNYNIDGIHMDDYFYPYPIYNQEFPDSTTYQLYGQRQFEDIDAWRRDNVNRTIQSLNTSIKNIKPWIQFGISPFGVWRNKSDDPRGSDSKAGTTNYDGLHADILLWMENKWIDYVAPQLYWGTSHPVANYNKLSEWWNNNHFDIPVYIGHGIYKVGSDKSDWQSNEQMPFQLKSTRQYDNLSGSIFFSYKHFKRDLLGFQDSLKTQYYKHIALVPRNNRDQSNAEIISKVKGNKRRIIWKSSNKNNAHKFIVYFYQPFDAFNPDNPEFIKAVCNKSKLKLAKNPSKLRKEYYVRVSSINRYGIENSLSEPIKIKY